MADEIVEEYKMWLAVRQDIELSPGKLAAQSGHAFGRLYLHAEKAQPVNFLNYLSDNEPKISVRVADESQLVRVREEAERAGIPCQLINDAGRSEVAAGTATVCAFGPALRSKLPSFLKRLQIL